jgi:hypothetical protein
VRRVARALNRRVTDIVALLFSHKVKAKPVPSTRPCARPLTLATDRVGGAVMWLRFVSQGAGSLGAVAGFAIAVVFAWKFLRPRRPAPKRPPPTPAAAPAATVPDAAEPIGDSGKVGYGME